MWNGIFFGQHIGFISCGSVICFLLPQKGAGEKAWFDLYRNLSLLSCKIDDWFVVIWNIRK